jgi:hypothetical protein|uniref:Uncharacterized protein n=1 Tax=viral metagenome TaxID=1070528 RepID=A0A6C0IIK7_9ZZZZ
MFTEFLFKSFFFLLFIFLCHVVIQHLQVKFRIPKPKLSRSLNGEKYNAMMTQIQNSTSVNPNTQLFDREHIEKLNTDLQQFMDEQTTHTLS